MKTIILDTNAPEAEALKAVNISATVSLDEKSIYFNGKQQVPYQGRMLDLGLNQDFNVRLTELIDATAQQPASEAKTKAEAKIALATTLFNAMESATETYMQAIYELNKPVIEEGE